MQDPCARIHRLLSLTVISPLHRAFARHLCCGLCAGSASTHVGEEHIFPGKAFVSFSDRLLDRSNPSKVILITNTPTPTNDNNDEHHKHRRAS